MVGHDNIIASQEGPGASVERRHPNPDDSSETTPKRRRIDPQVQQTPLAQIVQTPPMQTYIATPSTEVTVSTDFTCNLMLFVAV